MTVPVPFAALPRKDTIYKPFSLYLHCEKYSFVHEMGRFRGEMCFEQRFVHQKGCFCGEDRKLPEMMYICGKDHQDECICK